MCLTPKRKAAKVNTNRNSYFMGFLRAALINPALAVRLSLRLCVRHAVLGFWVTAPCAVGYRNRFSAKEHAGDQYF